MCNIEVATYSVFDKWLVSNLSLFWSANIAALSRSQELFDESKNGKKLNKRLLELPIAEWK